MRLHRYPSSQAIRLSPCPLVSLSPCRAPRRGVVLLVVLIMLTLFAIVGITFVYLSDQQAVGAGFYKEAETKPRPEADVLLAHFLNQLAHDTRNAASSLQTHGQASGMFGVSGNTPFNGMGRFHSNEQNIPVGPPPFDTPVGRQLVGLDRHDLLNFFGRSYWSLLSPEGEYGALSVPYTYPDNNYAWLAATNADGLIEFRRISYPFAAPYPPYVEYVARSFTRPVKLPLEQEPPVPGVYDYIPFDPYAASNAWWLWARATYWMPSPPALNPYTPYPDGPTDPFLVALTSPSLLPAGRTYSTAFLAAMRYRDPSTGIAVLRNQLLRAMVTRPGPWDHPDFAPPDDVGGDVKNLPPGSAIDANNNRTVDVGDWFGNDSYWQHIGFPIQVGADGRRYVPLFAMHIQALDGKINVNTAGNVWGANAAHTSNQGWGGWEVNPFRLWNLPSPGGPTEGVQLFRGRPTAYPVGIQPTDYPLKSGKYGLGVASTAVPPNGFFQLWPQRTPFYSRFDADGARDGTYNLSDPFRLPGYDVSPADTFPYDRFPRYFAKGWTYAAPPATPPAEAPGADWGFGSGNATLGSETLQPAPGPSLRYHPGAFNYFAPQGANRLFPVSGMEALLRHGDTGADSLTSDLRDLLINNMTSTRARRLLTAHSADIERPGVLPYWDGDQSTYVIAGGGPPPPPPALPPIREMPPRGPAQATPGGLPSAMGTEFGTRVNPVTMLPEPTWRALSAILGKVDINRPLPQYPLVQSDPALPNLGRIVDVQSFNQALLARQELARDIYRRLLAVTGAEQGLNTFTPPLMPVPPDRVDVLRYLAQLAVNIVDARDSDDYNTSFDWGAYITSLFPNLAAQLDFTSVPPTYSNWVFGTELPRVVINEVYVEHPSPVAATPTDANLWVELYNPLRTDSNLSVDAPALPGGAAKLQMPASGANPSYGIYRLIIARTSAGLRDLDNVRGDVLPPGNILNVPAGTPAILDDWSDPDPAVLPNTEYIFPSDDNYSGIRRNAGTIEHQYAPDRGWFLLGPLGAAFPAGGMPYPPVPTATLSRPQLTVRFPPGPPFGDPPIPQRPTLVLQRLMCPHLPPQPDPTMPGLYNPYITVDYFEAADLNDTGTGPVAGRHSVGRKQPYAARLTVDSMGSPLSNAAQANIKQQTPDTMPPGGARADQPHHTFLRHNSVEEVNYTIDSTIPAPAGQVDTLKIDYVNNATGAAGGDGNPEAPADPPSVSAPPPTGQTLKVPFDWLQHFDRDYVSPMELLHVSGFKQHELTQQFMVDRFATQLHREPPLVAWPGGYPPAFPTTPPGPPAGMGIIGDWPQERFQHVIRWFDDAVNLTTPPALPAPQSNRLQRALEFLQTRNRAAGTSQVTLNAAVVGPVDPVSFPFLYRVQVPALNWASTDAAGNVVIGRGDNGGLWYIRVGDCVVINGGAAVRVTNVLNPSPGVYQFDAYFPGSIFQPVPNPALPPAPPVTTVTVTYLDGRQPGKVDINLLNDIEVWRAICDAQPANTFNPPLPFPFPTVPQPLPIGTTMVTLPAGSATFVAGPPDTLAGSINGVAWVVTEAVPPVLGPPPTSRGTFLEFNDPVNGRETVEVIDIVDTSGAGTGPFNINFVVVDHNLNRVTAPLGLQINHIRNTANPFPIAVDNVSTMFQQIVQSRDAGGRPFYGMASGFVAPGDTQHPTGTSIVNTLLRRDPVTTTRGLFETPNTVHPQRAQEILTKIANNLTTRSNVFAVWVTVGFFEVDGAGRIGAEIGRADGRHKRHRMFAIIDRTNFDGYVQTMDAYLRTLTGGEYGYDVSQGAVQLVATPTFLPNPQPSTPLGVPQNIVIPIVGSNLLDPRRPYVAQVSYINPLTATVVTSPPITLPPTVLYWSIIE